MKNFIILCFMILSFAFFIDDIVPSENSQEQFSTCLKLKKIKTGYFSLALKECSHLK